MKITKLVLTATMLMGAAISSAQATSVSYFLNDTNSRFLADGIDYAKVTISDEGIAGNIDFSVELLIDGFSTAGALIGPKMHLKTFLFNFNSALSVGVDNIDHFAPADWSVVKQDVNPGGGYGFFEFALIDGSMDSATTSLSFSIIDVDGDKVEDYVVSSTAGKDSDEPNDTEAYFAAHISGYNANGETSAKFASVSVVPVPAAVWLFGAGLLGLVGVARRSH